MAFAFDLEINKNNKKEVLPVQFKMSDKYPQKRDELSAISISNMKGISGAGKIEDAQFMTLINEANGSKIGVSDFLTLLSRSAFALQKQISTVDDMLNSVAQLDDEKLKEFTEKVVEEINPKSERRIAFG